MSRVLHQVRELRSNPVFRFLFLFALLYGAWNLAFHLLIKPYTEFDLALSQYVVDHTRWIMSLFGIETGTFTNGTQAVLVMDYATQDGVFVGGPCNGMKIFALHTAFILAFPGAWQRKLIYGLLGILIIHLVNVLRVFALAEINHHHPELLDFNHDYTFTILVYAVIILYWWWYSSRSGAKLETR